MHFKQLLCRLDSLDLLATYIFTQMHNFAWLFWTRWLCDRANVNAIIPSPEGKHKWTVLMNTFSWWVWAKGPHRHGLSLGWSHTWMSFSASFSRKLLQNCTVIWPECPSQVKKDRLFFLRIWTPQHLAILVSLELPSRIMIEKCPEEGYSR